MLINELKTGSGPLPSSDDLDFAVDHIARSAEQQAAGRTGTSRTVRVLAGELTDLARTLLGGLKNDVSDPSGREPYYLSPGSPVRGLDVIIDPAAQPALDARGADERRWAEMGGADPGEQAQRAAKPTLVPVRLESGTEDHEIEGEWGGTLRRTAVTVHLGRHQLGKLCADDGARLSSDLQAARQQNRAVWMSGYYYAPTTAARARLLLYLDPCHFPRRPAGVREFRAWRGYRGKAVQLKDMPTPEDFRRYRDVVDAVEQAWSGEGSVEARARLVQELEARGIPLPPGPLLDIEADRIAGGHGRPGHSRGIFHQFRLMGDGIAEIRKLFHNATPLPHPPGRGTYLVENVPQAEVLLHPGAGELVAGPPGAPAAGLVGVWLGNTEAGITVNTQGGQVGVLRDEDVVAYRSIMRLAHDKGAVPVMLAVLSGEPDGALRLRLGVSTR